MLKGFLHWDTHFISQSIIDAYSLSLSSPFPLFLSLSFFQSLFRVLNTVLFLYILFTSTGIYEIISKINYIWFQSFRHVKIHQLRTINRLRGK